MDTTELYAQREPIAAVTEGMSVVDSTGKTIGTVSIVRMGDADGHTHGSEPKVSQEEAPRLTRAGFLKIGGRGLFGRTRYAAAGEIADVADDTVTLSVPEDNLIH